MVHYFMICSPWARALKMSTGSGRRAKHNRLLVTSGCLLSRKVWSDKSVAFDPKMRYFTGQNGPGVGRAHENEFWVFSNSEITVTNT